MDMEIESTIFDMASKTALISICPNVNGKADGWTYVSHPPRPSADTCKPEFPRRRYCMPVLRGSSQAMFGVVINFEI
jgi:hypothetical protein